MVLKCTYIDEAKRIQSFLVKHDINSAEYTTHGELDVLLTVSGRLSPQFTRLLFEFINDNKMKVEVSHNG